MKQILSRLKPYLRWVIFGGLLFFLGKALKDNWQEVAAIRITGGGWICLVLGLVVTLLAHTWAGWVWSWTLREFKHPMSSSWVIQVYLKTNIAKYLPGNVWHYYGRISAVTAVGVPTATATLSVLIEPLLMAAAALSLVLIGSHLHQGLAQNASTWNWQVFCLVVVLMTLHPWFLNPLLRVMEKLKEKAKKSSTVNTVAPKVERYPLIPLLGEVVFLGLRCMGFLLIFFAISPVNFSQVPLLVSAFSLAWLLGLVIPAAPGGIGVFEATAIALLNRPFSTGIVLSVVALYRFISVLAETAGAGLASLSEREMMNDE